MQNLEPLGYTATQRWSTESFNSDIAIQSAASPSSACARPAASHSARFAFKLPPTKVDLRVGRLSTPTPSYRISETFGGSVRPSRATPYTKQVLSKCNTWYLQTRFLYINVVQCWCCGDATFQILENFDFQMNRAFVSNISFYQCVVSVSQVTAGRALVRSGRGRFEVGTPWVPGLVESITLPDVRGG